MTHNYWKLVGGMKTVSHHCHNITEPSRPPPQARISFRNWTTFQPRSNLGALRLTAEEWWVEAEARQEIVTHTCWRLAGGVGKVSQHSHSFLTSSMPAKCTRYNHSEIGQEFSSGQIWGPQALLTGNDELRWKKVQRCWPTPVGDLWRGMKIVSHKSHSISSSSMPSKYCAEYIHSEIGQHQFSSGQIWGPNF